MLRGASSIRYGLLSLPDVIQYVPKGTPPLSAEDVTLPLDELESIKLADYEGLYQEEAALKMEISRQTFGRIIESAHKKIADALVHGKILKIEGGNVSVKNRHPRKCKKCPLLKNEICERKAKNVCPKNKITEKEN